MASRRQRIFYFCYDHVWPRGGQKDPYQHVDALNRGGFDARVLHTAPNFRLTWFENETKVNDYTEFKSVFDPARDFIVFPEDMGARITQCPGRKVIFNKNVFYGFAALGMTPPASDPYRDHRVVAAFVVSSHNARQLRFAYPALDVYEVALDLKPDVFTFQPLREKQREIATIAKGTQVAAAYQIFRARAEAGLVPGGPCAWQMIERRTEREVAELLRQSLVFVFQSVEEGLPRLPLEALLCGCIVVGHDAGPLKEVLPPEFRCEYASPAAIVGLIERVLADWPGEIDKWQGIVREARERALRYSGEIHERSVCDAWESILTRCA